VFDAEQAHALALRVKSPTSDLQHESIEDQRHYHMHRLTVGWITIAGFAMLLLACLALFVLGGMLMVIPAAGTVAVLLKGVRMVTTARRGLRALAEHDARLPKARLLR
jgi:hypothetical protein